MSKKNKPRNTKKNHVVYNKNTLASAVQQKLNSKNNIEVKEEFSTLWNDLEEIYQAITNGLVTVLQEIENLINNKEALHYIQDKKTLNIYIETLNKDALTISDKLNVIHEQHKNKENGPKDEYELQAGLSLFEQYNEINTYFHTNITGIVSSVTELFIDASVIMNNKINDEENNIEEAVFEEIKEDLEKITLPADTDENNNQDNSKSLLTSS